MPTILDDYRQATGDTRSDDELLVEVARSDPSVLAKYPELQTRAAQLLRPAVQAGTPTAPAPTGIDPNAYDPTTWDYTKQIYGNLVRGLAGIPASPLEELGIQSAAMVRATGVDPLTVGSGGDPGDPTQRATYQLGQGIRQAAENIAPERLKELEGSFWAEKLPQGIGSSIGFLLGGAVGKAMKIPGWISIAALGSASSATDFYQDAKSKGADEKTAYIASLVGNIVGTSEAFPLAHMLNRLDDISGHTVVKTLVNAGKETFEEALQEAAQQLAQNYTAQQLYDKDRALWNEVKENAAVGGTVGFLASLIISGLSRHGRAAEPTPPPGPRAAPATATVTPVIPTELQVYTQKNDGNQVTTGEMNELAAMARQELSGQELDLTQKNAIDANPAYRNAFAILKSQLRAEQPVAAPEATAAVEAEKAVATEEKKTDPAPTEAQKKAGNYAMGKVNVDGLQISIENAEGSTRTGKDSDGEEWSVIMPATYGYIRGTKGKDKDHIDIYLGKDLASPNVFVVNQTNPDTGKFDEHKVMYGFGSVEDATKTYDAAFSDGTGPTRRESITLFDKEQFKKWLLIGDKTKEATLQKGGKSDQINIEGIPGGVTQGQGAVQTQLEQAAGTETAPGGGVLQAPQEVAPTTPAPAPVVAPAPTVEQAAAARVQEMESNLAANEAAKYSSPEEESFQLDLEKTGERYDATKKAEAIVRFNPTTPYTDELGKLLSSNVRVGDKSADTSLTKQLTFFLDTKTGEVIGLPTSRNKGGSVAAVPDATRGSTIKNLMAGKRYQLVGSVTKDAPFKYSNPLSRVRFRSMTEFENFAARARERLEAVKGAVTAGTATPGVQPVTTETPAQIAQAAEGFTPDEAKSIWDVVKHVNADRDAMLMAVAEAAKTNDDVRHALNKLITGLMPLEDIQGAIPERIQEVIHEQIAKLGEALVIARRVGKAGKEQFISFLVDQISSAVSGGRARAGQQAAATTAGTTSGVTGAELGTAGTIGPSTTTGTTGTPGQGAQVRFHSGFDDSFRGSPPEIASAFHAMILASVRGGLNVNLLNQEAAGMRTEFGSYNNADRVVAIVMGNVGEPTSSNLYHLGAEVSHAVFASLSEERQVQLQNAIRGATDEMLGIAGPFVISDTVPDSQRAAVEQEERLVDVVARHLALRGFNAAEADSFARRWWRALKQLLLRAAMAMHRAWVGGSSPATAYMAAEYLRLRVEGFLDGNIRQLSFIDFMGGPAPQVQERNLWHGFSGGFSSVSFRYNHELGGIEVQEVLPDSAAALLENANNPTIRYHGPRSRNSVPTPSPDVGPEAVRPHIAANNEVATALHEQLANWQNNFGGNISASGGTLYTQDQFRVWATDGTINDPVDTIGKTNAALQQAGKAAQNPATVISNLNPDAQRNAANIALSLLRKLQSAWQERYQKAAFETSNEPGSSQRKFDRLALRISRVMTNYTDNQFVFAQMSNIVSAWMAELRTDIKFIKSVASKVGVLSGVIKSIEGGYNEQIANRYAQALNRVVRRFTDVNEQTNFVNVLSKIAETNVSWMEADIATIKNLIESNPDPDFDIFRQGTDDSKALLAIAAAFAKRNELIMHTLALRRFGKTTELMNERIDLNAALKLAMQSHRSAVTEARQAVKKLVNLGQRGAMILDSLERFKAQQRVYLDEIASAKRWMDFYEHGTTLMTEQLARYERMVGAVDENFEAVSGALHYVPENPNQAPEAVPTKEYSVQRDSLMDAENKIDIAKKQAWLDAHPAGTVLNGSAFYNRLATEVEKMTENEMGGAVEKGSRSLLRSLTGAISAKLDGIGIPATRAISRMFRNYQSQHDLYRQEVQNLATEWSDRLNAVRKALGLKRNQLEVFFDRYYDPAWDYISRRQDLQVTATSRADAEASAFNAIRGYFGGNINAEQWQKLEKFLRFSAEVSQRMTEMGERAGIKINDEDAGLFRSVRGAPIFEMARALNPTIGRIYRQMWGEPGKPGPWSSKPLTVDAAGNKRDLAAEYNTDPTGLRASCMQLFADEVWKWFVTPLANRSGRAVFLAPADTGGFAPLAGVQQVRQALQTTQPGDAVGFAERLYAICGGTTDQGAFVAETLGTFNSWVSWLHNMHQEGSVMMGRTVLPVSQLMMHARQSDEAPSEWVKYRRYDVHNLRGYANQIALHGSFGRDLSAIEKLWTEAHRSLGDRNDVLREISIQAGGDRSKAKTLAKARGEDLQVLERASKDLATLDYELGNFTAWVQAHGGIAMEYRAWTQLLSTAVSLVVQGPKTAFIDTTSLFKPIQEIGLSTQSLAWTYQSIRASGLQYVGGLLEILGTTIKTDADHIAMLHEHGQMPSTDQFGLRQRMVAAALAQPRGYTQSMLQRVLRGLSVASAVSRELLNVSIPRAAANPQFIAIKPAAFTLNSQVMHLGSISGTWKVYESMVMRAARWLSDPNQVNELNDPTFRFNGSHTKVLGYGNKFFGLLKDEAAFESLVRKLNENGHTLERLAKDYVARGMTGRALSDVAYRRLMVIGPAELMQESSIISSPSWMLSNPVLHAAVPLVGWSIRQSGSLSKTFRDDLTGERKAVSGFIWKLAPIIGVSLAYALLADWYDEYLLHKKSNKISPFGGSPALGVIDSMATTGNVLGIVGDFANSMVNMSTSRDFSIDSRVFFVSSLMNISRALSTWAHQGTATYSTVYRPMMQSLGGSGALQYLEIFNNIMGADNAESRATARINAMNWLRVAGREEGLDVRVNRGGGTGGIPKRTTPWVREMALAAMAMDGPEFNASYRLALWAAREDGRENPEDYIKREFQSQHPLRAVFKIAPSEAEYMRLLRTLPDNGRRDVQEAVRLMNLYGERLDIQPFVGQAEKRFNLGLGRDEQLKSLVRGLSF